VQRAANEAARSVLFRPSSAISAAREASHRASAAVSSAAAAARPVFVVADQADARPAEALVGAPLVAAAPAVVVAVAVAAPAFGVAVVVAAPAVAAVAAAAEVVAVAVAAPAAVAAAVEEQGVAAPEVESAARYSAVAEADHPEVRPDRPGHDVPRGARPARSSLEPSRLAACPTVVEMPVARSPQAAAEWQASDAALRMAALLRPAAAVAAVARRTGLLARRAADRCPTVHVRFCLAAAAR
jgi:hypothetical protein